MTQRQAWRAAFAGVALLSLVVLFSPASTVPRGLPVNDKVVHGALFAALALTGRLAGAPTWTLLVGLVVYAGLSEVIQAVLPIHRDGDVRDALADTLGVLAGLGLGVVVAGRRDRVSTSRVGG